MTDKIEKSIMNNPVLVLFLATTVVIGSTASLKGALTMAVAVILVLVLSSVVIALLNKVLTDDIRFISTVIIVATVASLVQMLMNAFLPAGYKMVSLYVAILAVDLSIYANLKNNSGLTVSTALKNSIKTGLYYAVVILVLAAFREVFGSGTFFGKAVPVLSENNIAVLTTAPGGYVLLAFIMAFCNKNGQGIEKIDTIFGQECPCQKEGE